MRRLISVIGLFFMIGLGIVAIIVGYSAFVVVLDPLFKLVGLPNFKHYAFGMVYGELDEIYFRSTNLLAHFLELFAGFLVFGAIAWVLFILPSKGK